MSFQTILVVEDDAGLRHMLAVTLAAERFDVRAVACAREGLLELDARDFDVVLTDVRMPGMDGLALVREIRRRNPGQMVIVMSAYGDRETALGAVVAGAYEYIDKPFKAADLALVLRKAEEREKLSRENQRLRAELSRALNLERMVGSSAVMEELHRQVRKVAAVKTTVLITGESGTGKELIARSLHANSPRSAEPFVAVNCGAIPEALIESELFGHVKGAFTDAVRTRRGLFTEADGGTLFLDEVGELPLTMQVKLLRVLQDEEVRRVGDTRSEKVDVRVVAATVRDLPKEAAAGRFREDLFYRLNVVALRLPPLRERREDIPPLVEHFIAKYNVQLNRRPPVTGVAPDAMEALLEHPWRGNVRELENAIERAIVLSDGETLTLDLLPGLEPPPPPAGLLPAIGDRDPETLSVKRLTRSLEIDLIRRALRKTRGNRTRAARLLEISHRALLYKVKEYGIDPDAEGALGGD